MTDAQIAKLIEMIETTEKHLPTVRALGVPKCMEMSVAKYWPTLVRLAAE